MQKTSKTRLAREMLLWEKRAWLSHAHCWVWPLINDLGITEPVTLWRSQTVEGAR